MYRSNNPQYTTPIEELPDLEELESSRNNPRQMNRKLDIVPQSEKYEKFLRNNYIKVHKLQKARKHERTKN